MAYYHLDHLGSVRMITDSAGQLLARYDYTPFGQPYPGDLDAEPRRFAQLERTPETGNQSSWEPLAYAGARYYQSQLGRFISPDTPGIDQNPLDPQSWNLYVYVRNNPLRYVDPTGQKCENGYNAESGAFCSETTVDDGWRFFLESEWRFQQQLAEAARRAGEAAQQVSQRVVDFVTSRDPCCVAAVTGTLTAVGGVAGGVILGTGGGVAGGGAGTVAAPGVGTVTFGVSGAAAGYIAGTAFGAKAGAAMGVGVGSVACMAASGGGAGGGGQRGERRRAAKPEGTPDPYKHYRPHPSDPTKVIYKDPHTGRQVVKPRPPDYTPRGGR